MDGTGQVLGDHSTGGLSPEGRARAVVAAAEAQSVDRVVAKTNQGGEMVGSVDAAMPVQAVKARLVADTATFAGAYPELEDSLCGLTLDGNEGRGGARRDDAGAGGIAARGHRPPLWSGGWRRFPVQNQDDRAEMRMKGSTVMPTE